MKDAITSNLLEAKRENPDNRPNMDDKILLILN